MSSNHWDSANIPDQKGKIIIVTGSSSGIGYEAARVLAVKGATVIMAVRNLKKGEAAAQKIKAASKDADVVVMELNLANLISVRTFVDTFKKKYNSLHVLINNAGVMIPPYGKTDDGFELQFGTNHLGHFALTGLLLEVLLATPGARIVNVSSGVHKTGNINFNDLTWEKRKYIAWKAYGDSKIANLYFTYELQKRLKKAGSQLLVTAAHPGWTATDLQRHNGFFEAMNTFFAQKIAIGALPTLRAAIEPNISGGEYFGPGGFMEMRGYPKQVESNQLSHDAEIAKKLWDVSEILTPREHTSLTLIYIGGGNSMVST